MRDVQLARAVLRSWTDAALGASADPMDFVLEWIKSGRNTVDLFAAVFECADAIAASAPADDNETGSAVSAA